MRRAWWCGAVVCALVGVSAQTWACSYGSSLTLLWPRFEQELANEGGELWVLVNRAEGNIEVELRGPEGSVSLQASTHRQGAPPRDYMRLRYDQALVPGAYYDVVWRVEGEDREEFEARLRASDGAAPVVSLPSSPQIEYYFNSHTKDGDSCTNYPPTHHIAVKTPQASQWTFYEAQIKPQGAPDSAAEIYYALITSPTSGEPTEDTFTIRQRQFDVPSCVRISAINAKGQSEPSGWQCDPIKVCVDADEAQGRSSSFWANAPASCKTQGDNEGASENNGDVEESKPNEGEGCSASGRGKGGGWLGLVGLVVLSRLGCRRRGAIGGVER